MSSHAGAWSRSGFGGAPLPPDPGRNLPPLACLADADAFAAPKLGASVQAGPHPEPAQPTPEPTPEAAEMDQEPSHEVLPPIVPQASMESIRKAGADLREILFRELRDLRDGSSNPQRAQAVAKLAGQIVASVRMEVEVSKIRDGLDVRLPQIGSAA